MAELTEVIGEPLFWEGQLEVWKQRDGWSKLGPHPSRAYARAQPRLKVQNSNTYSTPEKLKQGSPCPCQPPE